MALHTDYRPTNLDEVVGNDAIKTSLKTMFARADHPHSFLLVGKKGSGKSTLGKIIASMTGANEMDIHEYNAANTRGIDTMREIVNNMNYSGMISKTKVYILEEFHSVTAIAQEALLLPIESPPSHVYFILCTTNPEKIKSTITSRCSTFKVQPLTNPQMKVLLKSVLEKIFENVNDFSNKIIDEIIRTADGIPRNALVMLDQVIDVVDEKQAIEIIQNATVGEDAVIDLCRMLIDSATNWKSLSAKLRTLGETEEPEQIRRAVLGYLNKILLTKGDVNTYSLMSYFCESTIESGFPGLTLMFYEALKLNRKDL